MSQHILPSPKYGNLSITTDDTDDHVMKDHRWLPNFNKITGDVLTVVTPIKIQGKLKTITLSKFLLNPPPGYVVLHINEDKSDYRRKNLKICTRKQIWGMVVRKLPFDSLL
jgi:hypothetical protein